MKKATFPDKIERFAESKVAMNLPPLSCMSEIRQVETIVTRIFQPSEPAVEERGNSVRPGTGIFGNKIKIAPPLLCMGIDEVVISRLLGGRLYILGLNVLPHKHNPLRRDFLL